MTDDDLLAEMISARTRLVVIRGASTEEATRAHLAEVTGAMQPAIAALSERIRARDEATPAETHQAHIDALVAMRDQAIPGSTYARALEAACVAIGLSGDVREFSRRRSDRVTDLATLPAPDQAPGEPGSR